MINDNIELLKFVELHGPIESLNSRLKRIIGDANGFTDFERFRNRAMFALNYNEPIKN